MLLRLWRIVVVAATWTMPAATRHGSEESSEVPSWTKCQGAYEELSKIIVNDYDDAKTVDRTAEVVHILSGSSGTTAKDFHSVSTFPIIALEVLKNVIVAANATVQDSAKLEIAPALIVKAVAESFSNTQSDKSLGGALKIMTNLGKKWLGKLDKHEENSKMHKHIDKPKSTLASEYMTLIQLPVHIRSVIERLIKECPEFSSPGVGAILNDALNIIKAALQEIGG